jgi:hypothetical protein
MKLYSFERMFVHEPGNIGLYEFSLMMESVYGDMLLSDFVFILLHCLETLLFLFPLFPHFKYY